LEKVETSKNRSRVLKAKSLKSRVVAAMSSGEPIILKADTPPSEKDEKAKLDLIRQVEKSMKQAGKVSRTDYCLINIYRTSVGNTRATEYLDKKVAFTARGKLVKDFHKGLVAKKEEGDNDNDNESSEEGELEGDKQVS
ncbi:MAG: hypothetical protein NTX25_22085, partial [Proteobacteria bacterium]|nr:hypothetical protein [Pseudomonadota bacterium]